jgi:hypothetical protein
MRGVFLIYDVGKPVRDRADTACGYGMIEYKSSLINREIQRNTGNRVRKNL